MAEVNIMTNNVSIVIPWRDKGCPYRQNALSFVQSYLATVLPGAQQLLADEGGEPFSRGASIDQGVEAADHDLLLICDADIIVPLAQLHEGFDMATSAPGQVFPFTAYRYLEQRESERLMVGSPGTWNELPYRFSLSTTVGAVMILTRDTWRQAGGHDPRFRAWGGEDFSFAFAVSTLVGPFRRVEGPVMHLWHPSEPERPNENMDLMQRYSNAQGDPAAMKAIIGEEKPEWWMRK